MSTGELGARVQQVPPLGVTVGDRQIGPHRPAEHLPRVGVQAAGDVDGHGEALGAAVVEQIHTLRQRSAHVAGQPRAQQRIDADRGGLHPGGVEVVQLAALVPPGVQVDLGVAADLGRVRQQAGAHVTAAVGQVPRHHEAVAAVVSGPAQDRHGVAGPQPALAPGQVRGRLAGVLHEGDAGHTDVLDGGAVHLAHLGGGHEEQGGVTSVGTR